MNKIETIQSQIRHLENEFTSIYSKDKDSIQRMLSDRYFAINRIASTMSNRFTFRKRVSRTESIKEALNKLKK